MSPTQTREAEKPVMVVNLVPAAEASPHLLPSRPGYSDAPTAHREGDLSGSPSGGSGRQWARPLAWWLVGLVLACAWDRAVWLATSKDGVAVLARFEESGPLKTVLNVPWVIGTMWPWLVLAVGLIAIDWVTPDTRRVMHALRRATLLVLSSAAAGLAAEALKLVVRRERPFALHGEPPIDGWYVFRSFADRPFSAENLGMASSHAAVAFGAALALGAIWPRWRWAFLAGAFACALSRVLMGAHFLSDVYVGASLGFARFALISAADRRNNPGRPLASGAAMGAEPSPGTATMNTLDRYIARQYLFNAAVLLVILFSFVVAVDAALNADKFLESADKMIGHADGGSIRRFTLAALLILDLWWPRLLQLFTYLVGLVLVAAMGFTFTQMVRHREMVAALAGGVSLYRMARPVLIVAAGFMLLKVFDQEVVLARPEIAPLLARGTDEAGLRDWTDFPVRLSADAEGRIWLAQKFDPAEGTLNDLTVWVRDRSGQAQSIIRADQASWRAGGWDLTGARVESMQLAASGTGALAAQRSAEPPPARIETDLDPGTLKLNRFAAFSQSLSWGQISEMLASPSVKPDTRERLQRTRWSRVSQILSGMLALIITMPFFLVREPKNMIVQSLKCSPIGIGSLIGGILLSAIPWPGLPPGFAVFIPVFILIPVAIAVVSWIKT